METTSVSCNHCGAPLEVAERTRFVTCQFCNSQLEIKRTDSSIFTEEVARIAENTEKMTEQLEVITLQNEIEQLDREWSARHPNTKSSTKNDTPTSGWSATAGIVFSVIFALVCFSMASVAGSAGTGIFQMVPVAMGIIALIGGVGGAIKWHTRQERLAHHQLKRDRMVQKLTALKKD